MTQQYAHGATTAQSRNAIVPPPSSTSHRPKIARLAPVCPRRMAAAERDALAFKELADKVVDLQARKLNEQHERPTRPAPAR